MRDEEEKKEEKKKKERGGTTLFKQVHVMHRDCALPFFSVVLSSTISAGTL